MDSKLSRFCDAVIEAGWLAALIVVPLYFNIYSSRVFEPDKLSLLRAIVLVMAAAWLIRTIERGRAPAQERAAAPGKPGLWARIRGTPLVLPTLVMIAVYLISTIFSKTPRISWWGSYVRLQGTYTLYSYILIFLLMLGTLRRRVQLDRVIHTVILVSLPVALYGILQHYGLDPLPWAGDVRERVASSMGNAIFVAAYLLMPAFLTIYRLIGSFSRILRDDKSSTMDAFLAGAYLFVLAVQLVAIFFTQSRGPWLGLAAGLFVLVLIGLVSVRQSRGTGKALTVGELAFGILLGAAVLAAVGVVAVLALRNAKPWFLGLALLACAIAARYLIPFVLRRGLRWLWVTWVSMAALAAGFLVLFNVPGTPLASLKSLPYVGRLGQIFEMEGGTGKVRVLIWEGATKMVAADPVRTIIGYGPESMYVTYEPFYPPDLAHYEERNRTPDRSHNQTFDTLIATGVLGFGAYMFLFGSVFYYGLRWLGLMRTGRDRNLFIGLIAGFSVVAVALARLLTGGFALAGVSLPLGVVLGLALYLVIAAVQQQGEEAARLTGDQRMLLTALMAAVLGHFVEIHFGFDIASTATYFWAFIALFALVGMGRLSAKPLEAQAVPVQAPPVARRQRKHRDRRPPQPARAPISRPVNARWAVLLAFALVTALVIGTLMYDFTSAQLRELSAGEIVQHSLFAIVNTATRAAKPTVGTAALMLLTVLVGGIIALREAAAADDKAPQPGWYASAAVVYAVVAIVPGWIIALLRADVLRARQTLQDISAMVPTFYIALFALVALLAVALWRMSGQPRKGVQSSAWLAYPVIAAAAFLGVWTFNLTTVRADIQYQQGFLLEPDYGRQASKLENDRRLTVLNSVLGMYQKAIGNAPNEDFYYLAAARIYQQMAPLAADPAKKSQILQDGLKVVEAARKLYPLNVDHTANLGRLYRTWAQESPDAATRAERLQLADKYYGEATRLSPNKAHLYNEWAVVKFAQGDNTGALQKLERSRSLDPKYDGTYLLLAEYYARAGDWANSEQNIQGALEASTQGKLESYNQYFALESLYEQAGKYDLAEKTLKAILQITPGSVDAQSMLGYVLSKTGRYTEAIEANLRVLQLSPQDFVSNANLAFLYDALSQPDEAIKYAKAAEKLADKAPKASADKMLPELKALVARLEQGPQPPK